MKHVSLVMLALFAIDSTTQAQPFKNSFAQKFDLTEFSKPREVATIYNEHNKPVTVKITWKIETLPPSHPRNNYSGQKSLTSVKTISPKKSYTITETGQRFFESVSIPRISNNFKSLLKLKSIGKPIKITREELKKNNKVTIYEAGVKTSK